MSVLLTATGYFFGILLLFLVLLLVTIQTLLNRQKLFDPAIKWLCRIFPLLFGIRVKTRGLEKIDPEKTYIFMANHVNIFDGFLLYGYIPHFFRGVELEDHFSWPVWGTITKKMGNIPISQKNTADALKSLSKANEALSKGTSITILPEGHRTRNGKLQSFMRGPFLMAKNSEADIVPIAMKGLWKIKSVKSVIVRPGTVELVFGDPVAYEYYKDLSDRKLRNRVKDIISSLLDSPE